MLVPNIYLLKVGGYRCVYCQVSVYGLYDVDIGSRAISRNVTHFCFLLSFLVVVKNSAVG